MKKMVVRRRRSLADLYGDLSTLHMEACMEARRLDGAARFAAAGGLGTPEELEIFARELGAWNEHSLSLAEALTALNDAILTIPPEHRTIPAVRRMRRIMSEAAVDDAIV